MRIGLFSLWLALASGAGAQVPATPSLPTPAGVAPAIVPTITPWQHRGSDIPADPAWRTGILPNGLRFAVRRVPQPTRGISIRVSIDGGALAERDDEQGWAHLIEHMVFRGTKSYPDGEAVRIWQRLGATFGRDSNAFTMLTSTAYHLDLPRRDAIALDEGLAVLAEMMSAATIDAKLLATELDVVRAERALRRPPVAQAIDSVSRPLFLAGTRAEHRDIAGTDATLERATARGLTAFYHRWYRPERAVVVVTGFVDPAIMEAAIIKRFGGWTAVGPAPAEPDPGAPRAPTSMVAAAIHPQAREAISVRFVHPHNAGPVTVARQREFYLSAVTTAIMNARLAALAREGGPILSAGIGVERQRQVADLTILNVQPEPGAWSQALDRSFAVMNAIAAGGPSQAEIDEVAANLSTSFDRTVQAQAGFSPAAYADEFIRDVDRGDVSASPEFYRDLFQSMRAGITPDLIRATARRLLAGKPRMLFTAPTPLPGGDAALAAALHQAERAAPAEHVDARLASLDELKIEGQPATVVGSSRIADLGVERVRFSNGLELVMRRSTLEKDAIRLSLTVGHGLLGQPVGDPGLFWTAGVIDSSGVGPLGVDELRRLLAGRRISIAVRGQRNHVLIAGTSGAKDLADTLKLMTGELTQTRIDETALARLKTSLESTYPTLLATPATALAASVPLLYGGDQRFEVVPPPERAHAVTLDAVRAFWRDALGEGPVRLVAVGDFDRDAMVKAVTDTLGRLPPRESRPVPPANLDVRATKPNEKASVIYHRGDPDQASVMRVIPVPALLDDLSVSRALGLAAEILSTRLADDLRARLGGTYAANVTLSRTPALPRFGELVATAQLRPTRLRDFDAALDHAIAGLAETGPTADELARAKATVISNGERSVRTDAFWQEALTEDLDDPRMLTLIRTQATGPALVTAASVREVTRTYLLQAPGQFTLKVLPDPGPPAAH